MSVGYYDPKTKSYVKTAGKASIMDAPTATESTPGLLSPEDKKKIDDSYSSSDVATREDILSIFN